MTTITKLQIEFEFLKIIPQNNHKYIKSLTWET
jgi:hypothetical protein